MSAKQLQEFAANCTSVAASNFSCEPGPAMRLNALDNPLSGQRQSAERAPQAQMVQGSELKKAGNFSPL